MFFCPHSCFPDGGIDFHGALSSELRQPEKSGSTSQSQYTDAHAAVDSQAKRDHRAKHSLGIAKSIHLSILKTCVCRNGNDPVIDPNRTADTSGAGLCWQPLLTETLHEGARSHMLPFRTFSSKGPKSQTERSIYYPKSSINRASSLDALRLVSPRTNTRCISVLIA
jgi:hypothetical protein